jgi:predicted Kef-type K+ transport protein
LKIQQAFLLGKIKRKIRQAAWLGILLETVCSGGYAFGERVDSLTKMRSEVGIVMTMKIAILCKVVWQK